MMTSLSARPIAALARCPGPKTLTPEFSPISRATGPFTMSSEAAPIVLAVIACRLNLGSDIASTAVATMAKCSGLQPAIAAFTATFSAVMTRPFVGSVASMSDGLRPAASRQADTSSGVGGMMGSPSVQPRSM